MKSHRRQMNNTLATVLEDKRTSKQSTINRKALDEIGTSQQDKECHELESLWLARSREEIRNSIGDGCLEKLGTEMTWIARKRKSASAPSLPCTHVFVCEKR
jgi:hypothetical protein